MIGGRAGHNPVGLALVGICLLGAACGAQAGRQPARPRIEPAGSPATANATVVPSVAARASATSAASLSATIPTPSSEPAPPAVAVYRGRSDTNAVALTFDAGADVGYAALILDTLRRNGIHATFGMTGQWAAEHPDLVREMAADGDEFINHTWDHQSFTGFSTKSRPLSRVERWNELDRTEAAVHAITGQTTLPYFRAPFGDDDRSVESDAGARGYRYDILWTVDTGGWAGASVGQIIAKSAAGAAPGTIIVMHVGAQSLDGPALQDVVDAIRQKGLSFATVSQLVGETDSQGG